ncbi:hypothetical protein, partial [Leadbetterella byssophila]|uniref:hypothetical protein n=1 Tax=Leadbetterella byssophila TaxID=316068 RepID=UPI0039A01743
VLSQSDVLSAYSFSLLQVNVKPLLLRFNLSYFWGGLHYQKYFIDVTFCLADDFRFLQYD